MTFMNAPLEVIFSNSLRFLFLGQDYSDGGKEEEGSEDDKNEEKKKEKESAQKTEENEEGKKGLFQKYFF